ncbi:MAG: DNA polymerase I [Elusimicrobiaceae bacterium]|nr:DNA polymerase I [Elusimicrobiaceae bacterium]
MSSESSHTFFLIDAHGFLHRNYHALPKLSTSTGQEVGALYGFARWLAKLLQEKKPAYVAVCFDSKGGCARRKMLLPTYKANRKKPEDALLSQLSLARDMVRDMGLAVVAQEGIEADDLMAFLALQAQQQHIPSVLVTSDKDVYQFLSPLISVWPSGGKEGIKGPEAAEERFGVAQTFLPDYFSIVGDSADNVPGVAGVGPKTTVELIRTFGHLEDILRAAQNDDPRIKPALAKKLREQEGNALLSKQLVVLDPSLQMPFNLADYQVQPPDPARLEAMCARYEFKNLLPAFKSSDVAVSQMPTDLFAEKHPSSLSLKEILELAQTSTKIGLYVEDEHLLLSISASQYTVLPVAEIQPWELNDLQRLVFNDAILKVGYDLKFTLRELQLSLEGRRIHCFDERLARYMLDPSGDLSPAGTIAHYFSALVNQEDPTVRLAGYNAYLFALHEKLEAELKAKQMWDLYQTLELPLMTVLAEMEHTGMKVDCSWLESFKILLEQEMGQLQDSINKTAGTPINIHSTRQLGQLLFEQLALPPVKKTKTGYSTDEEVLQQIASLHPVVQQILEYRTDAKLKGTYVDNLLLMADEQERVHSYLDQTGTVTGRLSSSAPNLQNIPVRTEKGRQLRRAFCASPGNVLLSIDYSQIDLRVLAHESKDPVLVQAFLDGGDIHTQTAAQIFNVMPLMVTDQMRSSAKAVNFGIIYGQGPLGLSQALHIPMRQAKEYIDQYFHHFQGVRRWIDENVALARQNGFVKTMFGHIRYLPEFNMGVASMASFAQRAAINTIVQGGSADIIKKAMVNIFEVLRNTPVKMIMQVHDELIFEVPEKELDAYVSVLKTHMQQAVTLRVPLVVSAKAGANWYELKKIS